MACKGYINYAHDFPQFYWTQVSQPKTTTKDGETEIKKHDLHVLGTWKIASADDFGKLKVQ